MTDIERRIRAATGWTAAEYRKASLTARTRALMGEGSETYQREYDRLKAQVRNYNRLTGQNVSAARLLYNKYAFKEPSRTLKTVESLPTSRLKVQGMSITGQSGKEVSHEKAGRLFSAGYYDFYDKFGDPDDPDSTYGFFASASDETRAKFSAMIDSGATPAELFREMTSLLESNRQARKAGNMRGRGGRITGSDL